MCAKKTETKRKRASTKAKKDPNAPKKPLTGYMLFCQEERENVKADNPEMKAKEIMSELGKRWKDLDDDEKAKYNDQYKAAKVKYDADVKKYKAEKEDESEEEEDEPPKKKRATRKPAKKTKKQESEDEEEDDDDEDDE